MGRENLTLREELILGILQQHVGRSEAVTSRDIAEQIPGEDYEGRPVTRREIRNIIRIKGVPIGACSNGYFIIENQNELQDYTGDLLERAASIVLRMHMVSNAYHAQK